MKIKRLIIRNIASIELGEIDFENGLIDRESGNPASLFLITGDTGSGKSVILDCISMALYGTTPRVKSVNGVKNNVYRNNDGEEISVSDITQYTRIGISWKDECYSELSFMGNDNVDYVARYSLGRTSHRNYRRPEWKLKVGVSEIIENRKDEIREKIQTAVGLSFEQFSRMAMLAQGQFATFLTGKKEERERILEQLTATDIFSKYGEAISNLYKISKQENETSKKVYEEFRKNILDETMHEELTVELSEKIAAALKCQTETEVVRKRILCTEAIIKACKDIFSLKDEASKLKAIEESPEYRKENEILKLWDKTTSPRELLSDRIKAAERLNADKGIMQEKKSELLFLSEDLAARKERYEDKSAQLEQQKLWIESQEARKNLFLESAATITDINRFVSINTEINKKEKANVKVNDEKEELNKIISSQKEETSVKAKLCDDCQDQINNKSKERDELNPISLRNEKEKIMKREADLNDLITRITSLHSERQETEKTAKETAEISLFLSEQKSFADSASKNCEILEKEKEIAESRYQTMHLSMKKNFEALRRQLIEDHASNCPLCGQSIKEHLHEWSSKEYFSGILSPLEEEKKKAIEAYNKAKKKADEAKEKMNTTLGSLKAKEEDLKKRKMKLNKNEKEIQSALASLGLEQTENLKEIIYNEISSIKEEIIEISAKLEHSDKLQKEIDELLTKKISLDKDFHTSNNALQSSIHSLAQKEEEFKQTVKRILELKEERESLTVKISMALKNYAEEWQDRPLEIAKELKKDAKEYADKTSSYSKEEPALRSQLKILESISLIQDKLIKALTDSETLKDDVEFSDVKSLNLGMLLEMWHNFDTEVSTINIRISENESKIREINKKLDEYYQESGTSETTLRLLISASAEISKIRNSQEQHLNEVKKNTTLLEEVNKTKLENLRALNLEDESRLENIETLRANLESMNKQYSELSLRIGAIKEKLEADEKTRKESEKQRADLELKAARMEKWEKMNRYFGGTRFRTLVQSHILRPLLHNANIYLRQITDHYTLTCSDENEQLSILVRDRYHNNEPRSVTVLSGGERFMVSLALSLALSSMNRPDMNVDILFIDEGFGTLDAKSLDMVMSTLRRLPEINGQSGRRVGVISHREELTEQIDCQIQLKSFGEGRSRIVIP